MAEQMFQREIPVCRVSVDGSPLAPAKHAALTRVTVDLDDKQIATQIARDHGLTADAPSGTAEHVMQANVSDAVFLRRLAQKNGNNLRISGKQLVIGPPASGTQIQVGPASGVSRMRVK